MLIKCKNSENILGSEFGYVHEMNKLSKKNNYRKFKADFGVGIIYYSQKIIVPRKFEKKIIIFNNTLFFYNLLHSVLYKHKAITFYSCVDNTVCHINGVHFELVINNNYPIRL